MTPDGARSPTVRRSLLGLGAIGFCFYVAEAAADDWSAIYLREEMGAPESVAGFGYAAFSLAMAAGRLAGDRVLMAFGPVRCVRAGASLAALSLFVMLAVDQPWLAVACFGIFGAGMCLVAPATYSAAGALTEAGAGRAIARVTTLGNIGLLGGPPIIGGLAELFSMPLAMAFIALLPVCVAVLAPALRPAQRTAAEDATSRAP